jgi:hypothetical protein
MEEHIPPHHLAVLDSDTLDMAQLGPTAKKPGALIVPVRRLGAETPKRVAQPELHVRR